MNLFLGPGGQWGSDGGWQASAPGFNWARIDGMEIEVVSQEPGGPSSAVSLADLP